MKLQEIYQYNKTIPFELDVELERQADEYSTIPVTVSGIVRLTPDPYGTGDSPTDYEVDVKEVIDKNTGKAIDVNSLSDSEYEFIENKAVDSIRH